MDRRTLLAGSLVSLAPLLAAENALAAPKPKKGERVILVNNGEPKTAIYVAAAVMEPDDKSHARLRASVNDLAAYLERLTGGTVPVHTRAPAKGDKAIPILIGDLATEVFGPPAETNAFKQGWRLAITRKGVGIIGESDEAVSFALYEFLDRLGCRWYLPSEMGESIPFSPTVAPPVSDVSGVPLTVGRNVWHADEDYRRRNRLGGVPLDFGHALEIRYLPKELLAQHPDWNAEIGGKRSVNGRYCWANEELTAALADAIIAQLDRSPTPTLSLSPDDGANFCECAKCRALDAGDPDPTMGCISLTDRYVHFLNRVATRVTAKHPHVKFGVLAYVQYTRPPVREKPHPSLVPVLAPITYCRAHSMKSERCPSRRQLAEIVRGWQKLSSLVGYYEYGYNLAEVSAPNPMIRKWSDDLDLLYAEKKPLFWIPETLPNFESVLPGLYLGIRKSVRPDEPAEQILTEFYARFYASAAEPMRQYWQIIDDAHTKADEHTGCGFGYARRFTPKVMKQARDALSAAQAACQIRQELERVKLADECFRQFERFMQLRWDLCEGRLDKLESDAQRWLTQRATARDNYRKQYAFSSTQPGTDVGTGYFQAFFQPSYTDGSRIARDFKVVAQAPREWRYAVDRDKQGEALGWAGSDFNDSAWKTTDPCLDSWSVLGLDDYYGAVFYRSRMMLPAEPAGKTFHLWVSSFDGTCRVLVNGQPVPYVNEKGETAAEAAGFCKPASFDITAAMKPGALNQITIVGARQGLNELGTGGLLGPVYLYRTR